MDWRFVVLLSNKTAPSNWSWNFPIFHSKFYLLLRCKSTKIRESLFFSVCSSRINIQECWKFYLFVSTIFRLSISLTPLVAVGCSWGIVNGKPLADCVPSALMPGKTIDVVMPLVGKEDGAKPENRSDALQIAIKVCILLACSTLLSIFVFSSLLLIYYFAVFWF